jgi:hypothetical protein
VVKTIECDMSYLKFYKKCSLANEVPYGSLCINFEKDDLFNLVKPTAEDIRQLEHENKPVLWWGREDASQPISAWTDRRKNIVLLLACLNNEL